MSALPASLQAIADLIGAPAALRIAERWGGTRLYVPAGIPEGHPLAVLIGIDAARQLSAAYAGESIEIAKADGWGRSLRNQLIRDARKVGGSQAHLAREHRLTVRQIRNIEQSYGNSSQAGFDF